MIDLCKCCAGGELGLQCSGGERESLRLMAQHADKVAMLTSTVTIGKQLMRAAITVTARGVVEKEKSLLLFLFWDIIFITTCWNCIPVD
jgi:hypothetical protein